MIDIALIVLIVFAGSLFLSVVQLIRQGMSLSNLISALIAALLFGLVLFVYIDVQDFRTNFERSEKLFLLQGEDGTFIAGFSGVLTGRSVPVFLRAPEIAEKQDQYDKGDFTGFVGENFKTFVVPFSLFDNVSDVIPYGNVTFSREEMEGFLRTQDTVSVFSDAYLQKLGMTDTTGALKAQLTDEIHADAGDDAAMRGLLFAQLFSSGFEVQGSSFLITEITQGNIKVYKETPLFMLIKYIPSFMLGPVAGGGEDDGSA